MMTESPNTGVDRDPLVSRAHVEQLLRRVGLSTDEIVAALDEFEFPTRLSQLRQLADRHGISRGQLTDRMGGSP